jgi:hypothetical protein
MRRKAKARVMSGRIKILIAFLIIICFLSQGCMSVDYVFAHISHNANAKTNMPCGHFEMLLAPPGDIIGGYLIARHNDKNPGESALIGVGLLIVDYFITVGIRDIFFNNNSGNSPSTNSEQALPNSKKE